MESREGASQVALQGELTIYQAQDLAQAFLPLLAKNESLVVDLSDVSDIDSSCAQLLMLARRHCEARGHRCALVNHSQPVIDVFETLGLVSWFGDPVILPGEQTGARRGSAGEKQEQSE
ncbi:MAG: STAS domain-containing protein [Wenzhouxiangella sp.]|nr:STAS domain-containing protein [Wenzhouxiangella sp.]